MKDEALALVHGMSDPGQALNRLREYLQAFVLRSFHESEAFRPLAFVGGTALRFLHNLPRFSEDLDFGVEGEYQGSKQELRTVLDTIADRSGIEFEIREHHESQQDHYPTHYVDISIQYRAVLNHPNTTSIDVMVDEHVAFDPVQHTHAYEDVPEFDLQAYSVEEIFAEKLRAIYQRGAARDYYDLYQLLETDSVAINFADVGPAFDAKCKHDGLTVDLNDGLPDEQQETIRHQWETTLPDLTGDPPAFEMVWEQLDTVISQQESS